MNKPKKTCVVEAVNPKAVTGDLDQPRSRAGPYDGDRGW